MAPFPPATSHAGLALPSLLRQKFSDELTAKNDQTGRRPKSGRRPKTGIGRHVGSPQNHLGNSARDLVEMPSLVNVWSSSRPQTDHGARSMCSTCCTRRSCLCSAPAPYEIPRSARAERREVRIKSIAHAPVPELELVDIVEESEESKQEEQTPEIKSAKERRGTSAASNGRLLQKLEAKVEKSRARRMTRMETAILSIEEDAFGDDGLEDPACMTSSLKELEQMKVTAHASHTSANSPGRGGARKSTLSVESGKLPALPGALASEISMGLAGSFKVTRQQSEIQKACEDDPPLHHSNADGGHSTPGMASTSSSIASECSPKRGIADGESTRGKPKGQPGSRIKRVELLRSSKVREIREQRQLELKQRQLESLPTSEMEAVREAFKFWRTSDEDTITADGAVRCLAEIGITAKNAEERKAVTKAVDQFFAFYRGEGSEARFDRAAAVGGGKLKVAFSRGLTGLVAGAVAASREQRIGLHDFAIGVVPQVRQKLLEMRSGEMLKQFFQYDDDGSGLLSRAECEEIASRLGLDQRLVDASTTASENSELDFEQFQLLISRGKERLDRQVRRRERAVQAKLNIPDSLFEMFRDDLVALHQIFGCYDCDASGALSMDEIMFMIKEFGLYPKTQRERDEVDEILQQSDVDGDNEFNFVEFLELIRAIREFRQNGKHDEYLESFSKYDRDKGGTLSCIELSELLADLGFVPTTYREQDELAFLIHSVDKQAKGYVTFEEFQVLCQRIEEKLKSMRYEEEIEYAMMQGFNEKQMRTFRWIFDALDADGSGKLDASEVRNALKEMEKKVTAEVFDNAFETLDADGSGELDFQEFLAFMRMMRESEGLFSEGSQQLANRVREIDLRVLRRVLTYFHLSQKYLNSLSQDELVTLFDDYFGVSENANLHDVLKISSVGQLYELAKNRAATRLR